jgi:hypothetical protein
MKALLRSCQRCVSSSRESSYTTTIASLLQDQIRDSSGPRCRGIMEDYGTKCNKGGCRVEHISFELAIEARNSRCDIVVMAIWIGQHMHIKSDPRQVGVITAARHSIEGQVRAYLNPSRGISGKERAPSRSQPTSQELKWEESGRASRGPSSSSKSVRLFPSQRQLETRSREH